MMTVNHARAALMLAANLVLLVAQPARAAASSAWDGNQRSAGGPIAGARLAASDARVPKPATPGQDSPLSVRAVKREGSRVLVDVAYPAGAPVDLFAEGPTPDWALPVPSPVAGAPQGEQRFAFELDGLPPNTKPDGATLLLTAVAGERAIEVPYRLD